MLLRLQLNVRGRWWPFSDRLHFWLIILLFLCNQSNVLYKFLTNATKAFEAKHELGANHLHSNNPHTHLNTLHSCLISPDKQVATRLSLKLLAYWFTIATDQKCCLFSPKDSERSSAKCFFYPVIRGISWGMMAESATTGLEWITEETSSFLKTHYLAVCGHLQKQLKVWQSLCRHNNVISLTARRGFKAILYVAANVIRTNYVCKIVAPGLS